MSPERFAAFNHIWFLRYVCDCSRFSYSSSLLLLIPLSSATFTAQEWEGKKRKEGFGQPPLLQSVKIQTFLAALQIRQSLLPYLILNYTMWLQYWSFSFMCSPDSGTCFEVMSCRLFIFKVHDCVSMRVRLFPSGLENTYYVDSVMLLLFYCLNTGWMIF